MQVALPAEAYASMESKFKDLSAGLGTVLFFENQETWDNLVKTSPRAAPMVSPWGNVVSGMAQYIGKNISDPYYSADASSPPVAGDQFD